MSHLTKIKVLLKKIVTKLSEIWESVWESGIQDPRFGERDPDKNLSRILDPDPWAKKAPDLGSRSATLIIRFSLLW
jgi:hypothetical protein